MCGICGIINFNLKAVDQDALATMMLEMKHRGPDDGGLYIDQNIGLGFVRLSILDLSSLGHQPMFDDTGRFVITYNGEVYNYIEIREELQNLGYSFFSETDTEVILKAFLEWGQDCLHKFNGMWAFCIYDTMTRDLFFARDRFGVKPFYYYLDKDKFIYASEIPAILAILAVKIEPNFQAIFDYLVFNRTDQNEGTFFSCIKKLQHGHILIIKGNNIEIRKWYDLRERVQHAQRFSHPLEYKELLTSSVKLRLRSDVPVGVCLSGGLDSASIVSILYDELGKVDLNSFSAVYKKNEKGDESDFIRLLSDKVQKMFFTTPDATMLLDDLNSFVRIHAEPTPSTSPYAQFNVMKLAKGHVVVTLDGQGADECLAGYHYFFGIYFKELLFSFKVFRLFKEIICYCINHKSTFGIKALLFYLMPVKIRTKLRIKENDYISNKFVQKYISGSDISDDLYGAATVKDSLLSHFEFKIEHLLKWSDRNSMFFSLESRAPFLDYRLVEKSLASAPFDLINNGWTKTILRQAMLGSLPESIRLRKDKMGFETPQSKWFKTKEFQVVYSKLLDGMNLEKYGIITKVEAINLLERHTNSTQDFSREIWKVLNLEIWFRQFIT